MREYADIAQELHNAQRELEELESVERHNQEVERGIETLKEVQKALEEIAADAEGTSKTIEDYREKLNDVVEKLGLANEELAAALKEQAAPLTDAGGQVADGVTQFGEAAGEVSSTLKEIADRLDQVKDLIDLGEAPASQILEGFAKYFEDLVDLLGPLAERFPGLGAFVTIWVEAIRRIQGSIAQIEAINAPRRAQERALREEVSPGSGRNMTVGGEGPVAIRRARITELRARVETLREQEAAHPDRPVPSPDQPRQHQLDYDLARRAVEAGGGPTLDDLQRNAAQADLAVKDAKDELATWERTNRGAPQQESAAELQAQLDEQTRALGAARDAQARAQIAEAIQSLRTRLHHAQNTEDSGALSAAARGAELRGAVAEAEREAAAAHAAVHAMESRIREWLINDLRARGPGSGRPQWTELDHTNFNEAHPETPISPQDVQRPVGAVSATRAGPDRRPLALAAAGAVVLVVVAGAALATGFLGGQPSATASAPVAGATGTTPVSEPSSAATPAPVSSAPVPSEAPVGQSFESLTTHGLWPAGEPSVLDPTGDVIFSVPEQPPGHAPDYVDAILSGGAIVDASQQVVDEAFNSSTFDCNVVSDIRTICVTQADIAPGPILVVATKMAAQIPAEPEDGLVIYSLVLDSDGDPANDFEAAAPFTWDFYQGTDRWYELVYTPELGWYLTVDRGETPSDARVAIWGDHVIFFVPMSELSTDAPGFRTTAFASSDASYAPETSGGDVAPGPPDAEWELAQPAR